MKKAIWIGVLAIFIVGLLLLSGYYKHTPRPNSEYICCKVYGLGVGMKPTNIHYEWRLPENCDASQIDGGGRDIVADKYC